MKYLFNLKFIIFLFVSFTATSASADESYSVAVVSLFGNTGILFDDAFVSLNSKKIPVSLPEWKIDSEFEKRLYDIIASLPPLKQTKAKFSPKIITVDKNQLCRECDQYDPNELIEKLKAIAKENNCQYMLLVKPDFVNIAVNVNKLIKSFGIYYQRRPMFSYIAGNINLYQVDGIQNRSRQLLVTNKLDYLVSPILTEEEKKNIKKKYEKELFFAEEIEEERLLKKMEYELNPPHHDITNFDKLDQNTRNMLGDNLRNAIPADMSETVKVLLEDIFTKIPDPEWF